MGQSIETLIQPSRAEQGSTFTPPLEKSTEINIFQPLEMLAPGTENWQDYASCLGVDPDLFFPERGASTEEAKNVCRGCIAILACREYALVNVEKFGIWGGLSERERGRLRRRLNRSGGIV